MQPRMRMLLDDMLSCTRISQEVWEKRHGRRAARLKVEAAMFGGLPQAAVS
jgi:hypothetical protein